MQVTDIERIIGKMLASLKVFYTDRKPVSRLLAGSV